MFLQHVSIIRKKQKDTENQSQLQHGALATVLLSRLYRNESKEENLFHLEIQYRILEAVWVCIESLKL